MYENRYHYNRDDVLKCVVFFLFILYLQHRWHASSHSSSSDPPKALILFLVSHSTLSNSNKKSNYFICLHIIIWLNFSLNWTNFFFPSIITIVLRDGSYEQTYTQAIPRCMESAFVGRCMCYGVQRRWLGGCDPNNV